MAGAAGESPKEKGAEGKGQSQASGGRGAHTQGRREGLRPAGAELGPQGGIAPTESKASVI